LASAERVAHEFWSAVCLRELGRAATLLGEEAVFHPAGMPPTRGGAALSVYLAATGDEVGSVLETIASYDDMVITERIGRVVGAPVGRQQRILSLVRVRDGRITHWQDFSEPAARREAAATAASFARGA
jgi:limonene-1,2-epoxide hydrolase